MHDAIKAFLTTSDVHRCLLLVHPEVSRLERTTEELASEHDWPQLSVGRELSAVLLSQPPTGRSRMALQWMETRLRALAPGPVLCTEIDLLFEPTLHLDPLILLRQASRITRLVVAWPGSASDDMLTYAVSEHGHYRVWRRPDVLIAALD